MFNLIAATTTSSSAAMTANMIMLVFCLFYCGLILLSLVGFAFWVWMLVDVVQRKDVEFGESAGKDSKLIWVLLMVFLGILPSIIYYFIVYKKYPRI